MSFNDGYYPVVAMSACSNIKDALSFSDVDSGYSAELKEGIAKVVKLLEQEHASSAFASQGNTLFVIRRMKDGSFTSGFTWARLRSDSPNEAWNKGIEAGINDRGAYSVQYLHLLDDSPTEAVMH